MASDKTLPAELARFPETLRDCVLFLGRRFDSYSPLDEAECRKAGEALYGPTRQQYARRITEIRDLAKRVRSVRNAKRELRYRAIKGLAGTALSRAEFAVRFETPIEVRLKDAKLRAATKTICGALREAFDEIATGDGLTSVVNGHGELAHPSREMMQRARDALDRALAVYDATKWRNPPRDMRE